MQWPGETSGPTNWAGVEFNEYPPGVLASIQREGNYAAYAHIVD
jgi:hypothetical protein